MNGSDHSLPRKTIWEADTTNPEKAEALRIAWTEIMDPEIALNIIQLGLIREVSIREDGAAIRMILTTPYCPYGPAIMENARLKAEKILNLPVALEYGSEAWSPSMMDDESAMDWGTLY